MYLDSLLYHLFGVLYLIHKNRVSFILSCDIHTYDTRKSVSIYLPQGLTYYSLLPANMSSLHPKIFWKIKKKTE